MLFYLKYLITDYLKIWGNTNAPNMLLLNQVKQLPKMTQTTLGLKSFFNGDPLTLEEHKMLPYRITQLGKDNEETISRIENTTWLTELVDEYGEDPDQYESEIEEVVEMLIDGDTIRDDIESFVDDTRFGVEELVNFKAYTEACEEWTLHVVDAFIEIWDISDVEHIGDAFYGHFDSVEEFVDDYMDQVGHDVPSWLAIDYDRTWDSALRFDFDFDEDNGIMWCANW